VDFFGAEEVRPVEALSVPSGEGQQLSSAEMRCIHRALGAMDNFGEELRRMGIVKKRK
jgi:hypothetical protein